MGNSVVISSLFILLPWIVSATVLFSLLRLWQQYARLQHIPGPALNRISDLPRALWVRGNRAQEVHLEQHQQYGKVVRFGPNMISVSDPTEIQKIYGFHNSYPKADFYHALMFYAKGKPVATIFNTQDDEYHKSMRKPIVPSYSTTNVRSFEDQASSTIRELIKQLDARFAQPGVICPLDKWVHLFAFDTMGELTFSERLGFLERGEDVDGIMASIWNHFENASVLSQMPWADRLWSKNPVWQKYLSYRPVKASPIVAFALKQIQRKSIESSPKQKTSGGKDFLSQFLEIIQRGEKVPPGAVIAWTSSNVAAGSDTTATLIRVLFYNLLTNPKSHQRLVKELDQLELDNGVVAWSKARALPYLEACIKEAERMLPGFGLHLERVIDQDGITISGQPVPKGTVVGINPYVVHRDIQVFGLDSDRWNPDRWLCAPERRILLERSMLTFGYGPRSCIGKPIAYLETFKVVSSLLLNFDFEIINHGADWQVVNRWFMRQTGLNVRLKRRN